jgi:hypothetical protein
MSILQVTVSSVVVFVVVTVTSALFLRTIYNVYFHPLSKFPGPWYAASFSLYGALISVFQMEPAWLNGLVKKYGSKLLTSVCSLSPAPKMLT